MVVNTEHMRSLLELAGEEDSSASHLRDLAAEYEDYAARGKTMRHPRTGENRRPAHHVFRDRDDFRLQGLYFTLGFY